MTKRVSRHDVRLEENREFPMSFGWVDAPATTYWTAQLEGELIDSGEVVAISRDATTAEKAFDLLTEAIQEQGWDWE